MLFRLKAVLQTNLRLNAVLRTPSLPERGTMKGKLVSIASDGCGQIP